MPTEELVPLDKLPQQSRPEQVVPMDKLPGHLKQQAAVPDGPWDAVKGVGSYFNPVEMVKGTVEGLGDLLPQMTVPGLHGEPRQVGGSGVVAKKQAAAKEGIQQRAAKDFAEGNTTMGALRSTLGSVPVIGSGLENIANEAEQGRNWRAVGEGVGLGGSMLADRLLPDSVNLPNLKAKAESIYTRGVRPTIDMLKDPEGLSTSVNRLMESGRIANKKGGAQYTADMREAGRNTNAAAKAEGPQGKVGFSNVEAAVAAEKKRFIGDQPALDAMDRTLEGQVDTMRLRPGDPTSPRKLMNAEETQAMKRRMQEKVDFGHPQKTPKKAAQDAISKALVRDVANQFPGLADADKLYHHLSQDEAVFQRAVALDQQHRMKFGKLEGAEVVGAIAGGALKGGVVGGVVGAAAGAGVSTASMIVKKALSSPAVQTRIAVSLYRASGKKISMPQAKIHAAQLLNQVTQQADDEQKRGQSAE